MQKIIRYLEELLLTIGTLAIINGVRLLSVPAAWIVGGILLIAWAFLWAKANQPIVEIDAPKEGAE